MAARRSIQQGWAIARLTALETVRQPLTLLLLAAAVLAMAVLPLVLSHTLGDTHRMVADSTLSLHFLFGLFLAGFAACHALSEETRRGTGAMVLSKPVSRELFFGAKFVGIVAALTVFSLTATAAMLLSVRTSLQAYQPEVKTAMALMACVPVSFALAGVINFLTRRPFVSDAFILLALAVFIAFLGLAFFDRDGQWTSFGALYDWRLIRAGFLVGIAIWMLAALALVSAIRLAVVPTLIVSSTLFLSGLMSDYLLGRAAETRIWARVIYVLLPNWNHFWVADALHMEETIPWAYAFRAAGYGALYLIGITFLGMVLFRSKEVKT